MCASRQHVFSLFMCHLCPHHLHELRQCTYGARRVAELTDDDGGDLVPPGAVLVLDLADESGVDGVVHLLHHQLVAIHRHRVGQRAGRPAEEGGGRERTRRVKWEEMERGGRKGAVCVCSFQRKHECELNPGREQLFCIPDRDSPGRTQHAICPSGSHVESVFKSCPGIFIKGRCRRVRSYN